jgi:hypothetical protein
LLVVGDLVESALGSTFDESIFDESVLVDDGVAGGVVVLAVGAVNAGAVPVVAGDGVNAG